MKTNQLRRMGINGQATLPGLLISLAIFLIGILSTTIFSTQYWQTKMTYKLYQCQKSVEKELENNFKLNQISNNLLKTLTPLLLNPATALKVKSKIEIIKSVQNLKNKQFLANIIIEKNCTALQRNQIIKAYPYNHIIRDKFTNALKPNTKFFALNLNLSLTRPQLSLVKDIHSSLLMTYRFDELEGNFKRQHINFKISNSAEDKVWAHLN